MAFAYCNRVKPAGYALRFPNFVKEPPINFGADHSSTKVFGLSTGLIWAVFAGLGVFEKLRYAAFGDEWFYKSERFSFR